jgi:small GTP-binding protein
MAPFLSERQLFDSIQMRSATNRVILIGDEGVGKTSLAQRYLRGEASAEQKSTISAVFHTHEAVVGGQHISMQLWDTAGQECYRALGPFYCRNARAAVAVFDLTRPETKETLESCIRSFRENSEDPFVVIAANKSDVEVEQARMEDTVEWARALDAECIWTSAVTGLGVGELFGAVAKHLLGVLVRELESADDGAPAAPPDPEPAGPEPAGPAGGGCC